MCAMMLLPAAPGTCPMCATKHEPDWPHNAQSLFYQTRFNMEYGRSATWADALAHCAPAMTTEWRKGLESLHAWSEPPVGVEPIAEPCDRQSPVIAGCGDPVTSH